MSGLPKIRAGGLSRRNRPATREELFAKTWAARVNIAGDRGADARLRATSLASALGFRAAGRSPPDPVPYGKDRHLCGL